MSARYETFANKHLHIVNQSGDELMVRCVFHDDSNASMQFNIEKGLFLCFGCGVSGTVKKLERELGLKIMEDMADVSDIKAKLDLLMNPKSEDLPPLPEAYLSRYSFPTLYWENRGFTAATTAAFDLGADPFQEYVTIPIRNVQGHLLGVIKRYLDPDAELRYKYPKGFKRSLNLFGSWMVERDETAHTVALVEGSLDAIAVWQAKFPAMAIYGSSLSPTQIRILRRLGIRKVILFYDDDKAGIKAMESSLGVKVHTKMDKRSKRTKVTKTYDPMTDLSREFIVRVARYEEDGPKDPGDMTPQQIKRAIRFATRPDTEALHKDLIKPRKRR